MAWSSTSSSPHSPPGVDSIQPYQIHVSQKYLDLTRQKLELTRLPRDPRNAPQRLDIGVPKSDLEPLIDHWLESYQWRTQESMYNELLPQFRVSINGTRLHFVHKRSNSANAVPLLLIHAWPESFIAATKVINALSNPVTTPPRGNESVQAFHVVVPSVPGFGFSDPVPEAANNLQTTAEIFDVMMKGLGYQRYIIHGSGWGFKIGRMLALTHPESCIGLHTVNPEVPAPRSAIGYTPVDFGVSSPMSDVFMPTPGVTPPLTPSVSTVPLERPQTTAYALCDSPSGLLAHILDAIQPPSLASPSPAQSPASLRVPTIAASPASPQSFANSPRSSRSPQSQSPGTPGNFDFEVASPWPQTAIIDWAMLYWLPGPEVALRWLVNSTPLIPALWTSYSGVPLGISHFREAIPGAGEFQTPLQWAEAYHRIAMLRRRDGRARFPAWERPAELVADLREFSDLLSVQSSQMMMQVTNGV